MFCFIGGSIASLSRIKDLSKLNKNSIIAGTVLAVMGGVYIAWIAKCQLNKIARQIKQHKNDF